MTLENTAERRRQAAGGFGDGALYDANRPGYQEDAVRWMLDGLRLRPGDPVVDLGAGTGKFTRSLLGAGLQVLAVEPSEAMRGVLSSRLVQAELTVAEGDDRHIPAGDGSSAAVFAAQAFHWFDPEAALAEMARVLRPGGGVGLIWNERDDAVPWVHDLHVAMQWDVRQPYDVGGDFRPVLRQGPFERVERRRFAFSQTLDHDALVRRVLTTSYITVMPEVEKAKLVDRVRAVLAPLPALVDLPYVTDAYVTC
jgi:SAM-dependent methyltransferase